jgi:hypothetical protein
MGTRSAGLRDPLDKPHLSGRRLVFDLAAVRPREFKRADARTIVGLTRRKDKIIGGVGKRDPLVSRESA